jgi:hypothetical protein
MRILGSLNLFKNSMIFGIIQRNKWQMPLLNIKLR